MSLQSPVIDTDPSYVDLDETPREWCAECRAMTVHGRDRGGYPLCLRCVHGED